MVVSIITSTPLPEVWKIPLGVLYRYYMQLEYVLPLINPFAPAKEKPITDPEQIRSLAKSLGLKRGRVHDS